ncbi:MAG: ankyrin repeat domain-containing protein [Planctomycetes bacterium]|nr:ankyrin repeat domain-containing protein [Planctomycetota bacterium]
MTTHRQLPVRPRLEELEQEADLLLGERRRTDPDARLAALRLELAQSYGLASWERLVLAAKLTDAIWRDDLEALEELLREAPELLHEDALGAPSSWGPPLSYAASLGCDRLVLFLHRQGARDVQNAFERACLQGRIETARRLHELGARPIPGSVMGPCETLNGEGLALLLELGADFTDALGNRLAPVALMLQTYARNPAGKHMCLEIAVAQGIELPNTPAFAVHRGRIDLLEAHRVRDPRLFKRTFSHREIYPPELGCDPDESLALHGTPLAGAALLHLCVDFDEFELAQWMLRHGAESDVRAEVDADGFGGHTPLFGCVVSQSWRTGQRRDDTFARLLLDHDADPSVRASLRKRLRFVADESLHVYEDVTPHEWGERFHGREWVNSEVLRLLAKRGE